VEVLGVSMLTVVGVTELGAAKVSIEVVIYKLADLSV
jgi:hypothetical protein